MGFGSPDSHYYRYNSGYSSDGSGQGAAAATEEAAMAGGGAFSGGLVVGKSSLSSEGVGGVGLGQHRCSESPGSEDAGYGTSYGSGTSGGVVGDAGRGGGRAPEDGLTDLLVRENINILILG